LIPAVLTIVLVGEQATQHLMVLSQVILSLQLAFAVIPLIHFTSNRRNMGEFATPWWGQTLAWISAVVIVALNANLVLEKIAEWVELASKSRRGLGPLPLSWIVAGSLYGIALSAVVLLLWVTIKPFVKPSAPWPSAVPTELDWAEEFRPGKVG
jgi:manganese transport protein